MAVLDKRIQDKIDKLSHESYDFYEAGDKVKSYELMEKAWELYPEPRNNWNESYNTARYALDDLLKDGEMDRASIWIERMKDISHNLGGWEGNIEFYLGKYYFELGDYENSKLNFNKSFKESNGREFEDEDPKYKDFYLHPEKYMDK